MSEQDMLKKIKESAQDAEIPEALQPENIERLLEQVPMKKKSKYSWQARHLVAAAALLVIALSVMPLNMLFRSGKGDNETSANMAAEEAVKNESTGVTTGLTEGYQQDAVVSQGALEAVGIEFEEKQDAGEMYLVAQNEAEVYDFIKANYRKPDYYYTDGVIMEGFIEKELEVNESAAESSDLSGNRADSVVSGNTSAAPSQGGEKLSYSTTNLQMAGVDESDIVKTNGTHIFVVKDETIEIFAVENGQIEPVSSIVPELSSFSDKVLEMYVSGDKLVLIVQRTETETEMIKERASGLIKGLAERFDIAYDYGFDYDTQISTALFTYDISNPAKPRLEGEIEQDGWYKTSRKIGDTVYLFSTDSLKEEIPSVNGEKVTYDSIYLPESGQNVLIATSVSVKKPNEILDNTVIFNGYVEIYVSTNAMYLYNTNYNGNTEITEIAKFGLKNGRIYAAAATSVPGSIRDTFAINEGNDKLRVLTTQWDNNDNTNNLYILDENLKPEGSIKDIARGESIYAARYFGDLVYFITYRNMDPLFVADLSDSKNPKLLGELEITGYSEYLHMWGKDKLLGIGYETDPKDGSREGIKLVMFDITNPAELSIIDTVVLKNADYSSALDAYKCVLADKQENLIGFHTISYKEGNADYHVYSFVDGAFKELMNTSLGKDVWGGYDIRGLYIEDYFYLLNQDKLSSFDRLKGYEEVDSEEL